MKVTTYEAAREKIQDGDIIFLDGMPRSLTSALIQLATWSPYYHCGIAFWYKDRLLIADTNGYSGGNRIGTLSQYADYHFSVVRPHNVTWENMEPYALDKIGEINYSYIDSVVAYLKTFIKIDLNTKGEICSEMVARILNDTYAMDVDLIPDELITPKVLYKTLIERLEGYSLVLKKR